MASGVELGVGYISIGVETSGIPRQLRDGFRDADGIGRRAGESMGSRMSDGIGRTFKMAGALAGLGGIGAAFGKVLGAGNDFTNILNTMQSVSSATADEMGKVSARAKELGADADLSNTSASDAAAAMTELAKGGFSVDQSMSAAKGTLQLAAAAQIEAADAATIQSQALQAFGLNADYAAKTADILANGANASSAEITGIAQGLQQAGAVANQFGVSIEDTVTGLGMLANAGIQGSDAGTLLKSTLLALTDTSNPAQGAIEQLGLTVYDAQGKFVGMRELFGQLDKAAASMTPEMYQAATATLFGSDAMRLAGVAAEQGAAGWDTMRTAIDRQGAAAGVAAAKTQGLPGAMAKIGNNAETLALGIYDLVDGPLERLSNMMSEGIGKATPLVVDGLKSMADSAGPLAQRIAEAWDQFSHSELAVGSISDIRNIFSELAGVAQELAPSVLAVGEVLAKAAGAVGVGTWKLLLNTLDAIAPILDATIVPALGTLAGILEQNETAAVAAVAGFGLFQTVPDMVSEISGPMEQVTGWIASARDTLTGFAAATTSTTRVAGIGAVQMGRFGTAIGRIGQSVPIVGAMQTSFLNAAAGADRFGRMAGTAAAASTGLKAAASGAAAAFGGPLVAGIAAAVLIGTQLVGAADDVTDAQKSMAQSAIDLATAQRDVAEAFARTNGAVNEDSLKAIETQVGTFRNTLEKTAADAPGFWTDVLEGLGYSEQGSAVTDQLQEAGRIAGETSEALGKIKATDGDLAAALAGSDGDWAAFVNRLRETGGASDDAVANLQKQRDELEQTRLAAKNITPGMIELSDSVKILSDASSSAEEKTSALKTALNSLLGINESLPEAMSSFEEGVSDIVKSATEKADAAGGLGESLFKDGELDLQKENARALGEEITNLKDDFVAAAAAGGSVAEMAGRNQEAFAALGEKYGLTAQQVEELARKYGLVPELIGTLVQLNGADSVDQQLAGIALKINQLDPNQPKTVTVLGLTEDAEKKLRDLNFNVERAPDGSVKITAETDQARAAIDQLTKPETKIISIEEYVTRRAQTTAANPGFVGPIGGTYAEGGSIIGGIAGVDSHAALLMPGEHVLDVGDVARMGGQEAVYRFRDALQKGMIPKFAEGGGVGAAMSAARAGTGAKYLWGGTGPSGWDCSGWVGYLQQILMGKSPAEAAGTRLYTTYSLLGGSTGGLQPGAGPAGTVFIVGTSDEHMAAQLNGQPVESGGSHGTSRIGPPAVDAFDSQFHSLFHLPNELVAGGVGDAMGSSGGTSSLGSSAAAERDPWTEKDQLDLESARVAVIQAKEARDKANTDKKSDADRQQADLKVQRAELKVRELENKRDGVGVAKAMTPAPTLEGSMGEDAITLRQAEIAITDAQLARDKVYNDPDSTSVDKEKADLQVYQANNSLEDTKKRLAEEKEKGENGSGDGSFSVKDRLKKFGSDVAGIAVDSMFEILGVESRWLDIQIPEFNKPKKGSTVTPDSDKSDGSVKSGLASQLFPLQSAPGSFPSGDLANQMPVTPGSPNWIEDWMKTIPLNKIPLHDEGGWLMPGLTLNMTKKPEAVFNGPQLDNIARIANLDTLTPAPPAQQSVHHDNSINVQSVQTMSLTEMRREFLLMQAQRVASFSRR